FTYFCTFRGCPASIFQVFPCQKFSYFFVPKKNPAQFGTVFAGSLSTALFHAAKSMRRQQPAGLTVARKPLHSDTLYINFSQAKLNLAAFSCTFTEKYLHLHRI
ncbi:MAG: hypothetical protein IJ140_06935, partial [Prevotella sp.]|nr:hypothetical protein [Prevotella sp.]